MNTLLNNLQLYRGRRFSDLVDENMLSNALLTRPHEVAGLLSLVFGTKDDGVSTAIDLITGGLGKTMIIDNREYEWSVMIDEERAINIRWAKYNGKELKIADVEILLFILVLRTAILEVAQYFHSITSTSRYV